MSGKPPKKTINDYFKKGSKNVQNSANELECIAQCARNHFSAFRLTFKTSLEGHGPVGPAQAITYVVRTDKRIK